jgi:ABC-type oligopeptide transport system substrate-binding subunit
MSNVTKRKAPRHVLVAAGLAVLAMAQGPAAAKDEAKKPAAKKGWQEIAAADWKARVAADIMDIVAPAYQGFPESAEGKQRLAVEVEPSKDGKGITATVTKEGLLDDAVGAEQIRLEIERGDVNWRLVNAARRWQCRRGIMAGSWTVRRCP